MMPPGRLPVLLLTLAALSSPATAGSAVIYRASGVLDDGGGTNTGTATVFNCTNYDSVPATVRVRLFKSDGVQVADLSLSLPTNITRTFSSHPTVAFEDYAFGDPGPIKQGSAVITSTSLKIVCSAFVVPADATLPQGETLPMGRFNEAPGQFD